MTTNNTKELLARAERWVLSYGKSAIWDEATYRLIQDLTDHLASMGDDIRSALIEAISLDQGWEESAIELVDNVIMPILNRSHANTDALKIATDALQHIGSCDEDYKIAKQALSQIQHQEAK